MKFIKLFILVAILLTLLPQTIFAQDQTANLPIIISEFIPNPQGVDKDYEWIELYNRTDEDITLENAKLDGKIIPKVTIKSQSFLIIANNSQKVIELFPEIENIVQVAITLNNGADTVILEYDDFVDTVSYSSSIEAKSIERSNPECKDIWENHEVSNSISELNSNWDKYCQNTQISFTSSTDSVAFSPGLIGFKNESIYFQASIISDQEISRFIWIYENTEFKEDRIHILNLNDNKIQLKIIYSDSTEEIFEYSIKLYSRASINEVFADPEGTDTGKEWIEILSKENINGWKLSDLTSEIILTDIDNASEFKVVYPKFSINNSNEIITLKTPEGLISDVFNIKSSKTGYTNCMIKYIQELCFPTEGEVNQLIPKEEIKLLTIKEAKQFEEGKVSVQGKITLIRDKFIYIQDETGGIKITNINNINDGYYKISGIVKESRGEKFIEAEDIVSVNTQLNIKELTLNEQLIEDHTGLLVNLTGTISSSNSSSIFLTNKTNTYRIALEGIKIDKKKGTQYKIIGVVSRYGNEDDGSPYFRILIKEIKLISKPAVNSKNSVKNKTATDELPQVNHSFKIYGNDSTINEAITAKHEQINLSKFFIYICSILKGLAFFSNKEYLLQIIKIIY